MSATSPSRFGAFVRRPAFVLAAALLVVAVIVGLLRVRGPVVPTTTTIRTDIAQHIVSSGRVRVTTRVQVAAQVAGRVVAVRVAEGQTVEPGDVLVQLDDAEARAAVSQARAAVEQAKGRLDQVRRVGAIVASETSRQAATNLGRAESDLARVTRLAAGGAVSQTDLEEAQRAVEIARAQKTAADAQDAASTQGGADVRVADAALAETEARLSAAIAQLAHTRITAQQRATVLTRAVEPGDTLQPGVTLLELAADGMTDLVIEPDERNLAWIRVGQKARVSADAYPDQVFDAEVAYIAPAVDARRGSVEVRLAVANPPSYLRPDMTVSVDLSVASRTGVVAVASEAIRGPAASGQYVWVVERGRAVRRPVTVGIRGDGHVELSAGVDAGSEVVLATPRALEDGQRVRAERQER